MARQHGSADHRRMLGRGLGAGEIAWGQEWPLTDTRETRLADDGVSVPVHVASMCDPGHQRHVAQDREDDAVFANPELAEAGELPGQFGAGWCQAGQVICKLGENSVRVGSIEATQVTGH